MKQMPSNGGRFIPLENGLFRRVTRVGAFGTIPVRPPWRSIAPAVKTVRARLPKGVPMVLHMRVGFSAIALAYDEAPAP